MPRLHFDWLLILPTILLLLLGLTILKSVAPDLVTQQAVIMLIGLAVIVFLALTNYQILAGFSWYLYFLALLLLVITLVIGQTTRGSVRWIPLGAFRLQTSEIAKPLLILFFASFCSRHSLQEFKKLFLLLILFLLPAFWFFVSRT